MVALLVALTFIAALVIDAAVRRNKRQEQRVEFPITARPAVQTAQAARPAPRCFAVSIAVAAAPAQHALWFARASLITFSASISTIKSIMRRSF